MREAQQKALSLPQTGMVVSVDIGNPYDIHPKNKQDFGHRLALHALKVAYHQDTITDGAIYKSFEIKGDTIIVRMNDANSPLKMVNQKDLCSFEITGKDGIYQEASAFIQNNLIYVFSSKVENPISVRYAWTNNPKCCLFNHAGLPTAPFRTGIF